MEQLYNLLTNLELIDIQAVEENQAFASVNLNPNITWAKFTLTDDQPNGNKQRVPKEEFENLIKTGIYMPIKMTLGTHEGEHSGSSPLGAIAHLKVDNNRIKGLAALWNQERPEDILLLKEKYKEGTQIRLSWELAYATAEEENDGVKALRGVQLLATTIVGNPAYGDRTPIEALASLEAEKMEGTKKMDLEKTVKDLEQKVADLEKEKENLETSLSEKASELEKANSELGSLKEFKENIEKEQAEAERLIAIKGKFKEASLEKENEYFVDNKEMLLSMTDAALDFMLQEMVAGLNKSKASKNDDGTEIPPIASDQLREFSIKELAKALRERKSK